ASGRGRAATAAKTTGGGTRELRRQTRQTGRADPGIAGDAGGGHAAGQAAERNPDPRDQASGRGRATGGQNRPTAERTGGATGTAAAKVGSLGEATARTAREFRRGTNQARSTD